MSIYDQKFILTITDLLNQYKQLVIFHQIPWSGGLSEWFLLQDISALERIFKRGQTASAFTVYEWNVLLVSNIVNKNWLKKTKEALVVDGVNNDLLLSKETFVNVKALIELEWVGDSDDLEEYYQENIGCSVFTGFLPWSPRALELVRGYYPDENGLPVSGPY